MKRVWSCPAGHTFEVEDTADVASAIAVKTMRKHLEPGCQTYLGKIEDKNRPVCGKPLTETEQP